MTATVGGVTALNLELRRPPIGAWQVDAELDSSVAQSGQIELDWDGFKWLGTVLDSHVYAGRCHSWIVSGKGGLETKVDAAQYTGATVGVVAKDILGLAKETISSTAPSVVLNRKLAQWERLAGTAAHAVLHLCDRQQVAWRTLSDGTFWIGEDTWAEVTPSVVEMNEDWVTGAILLAPANDFNDVAGLAPGVTYRGHRIQQVVHRLTSNSLRTTLQTSCAAIELNRFLEPVRRELDYATSWLCEVKGQNADGTLQVVPVDKRLQGKGLDKVRIELGVPGTVTVPAGASVRVVFDARDPSGPKAVSFGGAQVTQLNLGAATDYVAHAAKTATELSRIWDWIELHTHPTGVGPSGPPTQPVQEPQSVAASKTRVE